MTGIEQNDMVRGRCVQAPQSVTFKVLEVEPFNAPVGDFRLASAELTQPNMAIPFQFYVDVDDIAPGVAPPQLPSAPRDPGINAAG
jgi:hypothetical protein